MAARADARPGPSSSHHEAIEDDTQTPGDHEEYDELPNALPDRALGDPWDRKVVLSLDGGGMRGYVSLLILERLMEKVGDIEKGASLKGSTAYPWCSTLDGQIGDKFGSQSGFQPHHYIDYFVGTSTGGLIAIMLGRLRYPVDDAKEQYKIVGNEVFKKPRLFTLSGKLRPRYSDKAMERILQEATLRDISHKSPNPPSRVNTGQDSLAVNPPVLNHAANKVILRAENEDAARTALVSQGGKTTGVRQTYIFRSYDHPAPNRVESNDSETREVPWNPGAACDLPIWKVARATSAAPTYFGPMKVGEEEFWDGAIERQNNPVRLAWNEVLQMHPLHKPLLVISIGTGRQPETPQKNKWYRAFNKHFHNIVEVSKRFQKNVLNSHQQHLEFRRDCIINVNENVDEGDRVKYYRFDVPGITTHKLDHWKGFEGDDTKKALKQAAREYCEEPDVDQWLDECARILVELRRRRAQTEHWERFALELTYSCPLSHSTRREAGHRRCRSNLFETRDALRQHAIDAHGFAQQIVCADATDTVIGRWMCDRDDCKTRRRVFEQRLQFQGHLMEMHGVQVEVPSVETNAQFEAWLDGGRQLKHGVRLNQRSTTLASRRGTDRL